MSKDSILSEIVHHEVKLEDETGEIQPVYPLPKAEDYFPRSQPDTEPESKKPVEQ